MKFGIHLDLSVPRPFDAESRRRVFDQALEQAVEAERHGFDFCWASEHHFLEEQAGGPAPEMVLAAIAARTSRLRLVMNTLTHPVNHPAVSASRAISLDVISHGRAELALSRPVTWAELSGFGADPARDVWIETIQAISCTWAAEPVSLDGSNFKLQERAVIPRPYQNPHPPIWTGAFDAETEREAGMFGVGLLARALPDTREQAKRIAAYKNLVATSEGSTGFVNDQVAILDLLYCHEGDADGVAAGERLLRCGIDIAAEPVSAAELGLRGEPARPSGLAIGDPRTIIENLRNWEAMGVDQVVFALNAGAALSQTEALSSLRLLASEVMPVFDRQRTRAAAE